MLREIRCFKNSKINVKYWVLLLIFVISQIAFVFYSKPYIVNGDEKVYKQIAQDIFYGNPVSSFHYPFLYPAILAPGLMCKQHFLWAMLCINIVIKAIGLGVIYVLLRKLLPSGRILAVTIMIACTPGYFVFSRLLLSENLSVPLSLITALYHMIFRREKISDENKNKGRVRFTIGAALLSLSLFWTKYLMLVLLPIFCLYWCTACLNREKKSTVRYFVWDGIVYVSTVCIFIGLYFLLYAARTEAEPTFELLKATMGFATKAGPESTGYALLPSGRWIICYLAYAILGNVLIVAHIIGRADYPKLCAFKGHFYFIISLVVMLIFVSARHSTLVYYNEGGQMVKLLGRYITYITPLTVVVWGFLVDKAEAGRTSKWRGGIAFLYGMAAIWIPYLILYKRKLWNPNEDWLNGCRGLENIGYLEWGALLCVITSVCVFIIALTKRSLAVILMCAVMLTHSVAAMGAWEKNNYMMGYAELMEDFLQIHSNEQLYICCNDSLNYVEALQMTSFYNVDGRYNGIAVIPIVWYELPIRLDDSIPLYFMLNIENQVVFWQWNAWAFEEKEMDIVVEWMDDDRIHLSYEGDPNSICVFQGLIQPVECRNGKVEIYLDGTELADEGLEITIYDLEKLQSFHYMGAIQR